MIVLTTLGAAPRRAFERRRKPPAVSDAGSPSPVQVSRATLVRAAAFGSDGEAGDWLEGLRSDREALFDEADAGVLELNGVLRAHRAAAADPYARDVRLEQATVARVGYGSGDQVAEGRFSEAVELPRERPAARRSRQEALQPQERLAAILGGRSSVLTCEELVLRARLDLDADRPREAALQARIAVEAVLVELEGSRVASSGLSDLAALRSDVGAAANAALRGEVPAESFAAITAAVEAMEGLLRRYRLASLSGE